MRKCPPGEHAIRFGGSRERGTTAETDGGVLEPHWRTWPPWCSVIGVPIADDIRRTPANMLQYPPVGGAPIADDGRRAPANIPRRTRRRSGHMLAEGEHIPRLVTLLPGECTPLPADRRGRGELHPCGCLTVRTGRVSRPFGGRTRVESSRASVSAPFRGTSQSRRSIYPARTFLGLLRQSDRDSGMCFGDDEERGFTSFSVRLSA